MKRAQLKRILKPVIQECIHEIILESGVLSSVITEVVKGLNPQAIVESNTPVRQERATPNPETQERKLRETKTRMLDAIGRDAYKNVDLFEGTEPLNKGGIPNQSTGPSSPLAHINPADPGVDISNIFGGVSQVWKKLI